MDGYTLMSPTIAAAALPDSNAVGFLEVLEWSVVNTDQIWAGKLPNSVPEYVVVLFEVLLIINMYNTEETS